MDAGVSALQLSPRAAQDVGLAAVLSALARRTSSTLGHAHALNLPFLPDAAAMAAAMAQIDELRFLALADTPLNVGDVPDVRGLLGRIDREAVLDGPELRKVGLLMEAVGAVARYGALHHHVAPLLQKAVARLPDVQDPLSMVHNALYADGTVRDDASAALQAARNQVAGLSRRIRAQMEAYLVDPTFATYLQDTFVTVRHERYVLPINASFQAKVPGIIHNASQTGLTLFIEPEAVTHLGNALAIAKSVEAEEVQRVLAMLCAEILPYAESLSESLDVLTALDVACAAADLAIGLDLHTPILLPAGARMHLPSLRHPGITLAGQQVIANTVYLTDPEQVLLLSGPNAGGKTVTLTSLGLAVLMAQIGLPIATGPQAQLPVYAGLYCAVSDSQSIQAGLSAFAAQLAGLKTVVQEAGSGWLILVDELGGDTDPVEGAALARAVLDHVVQVGAHACVTTHLEELKAVALVDPRYVNARVGYDKVTLTPTYRLERGHAGRSWALDVAGRMGFPDEILTAARAYLGDAGQLSQALRLLEDSQQQVQAQQEALHAEHHEVAALKQTIAQERATATLHQAQAQQAYEMRLAEALAQGQKEIQTTLAAMRRENNLQAAQRAAAAVAQKQAALPVVPPKDQPMRRPIAAGQSLTAGMWVRVRHLNQVGQVVSFDASHALVAMGALRSRVAITGLDLAHPPGGRTKTATAATKPKNHAPAAVSVPPSRCDVRGLRLDDALTHVVRALDNCLSHGAQALLIVHGHGTGALRDGVRDLLRGSPYVVSFAPGEEHEGGDGVTVVALDR